MPSKAKRVFESNKVDVLQLLVFHEDLGGGGPGRRYGLEVLNKSAIVFITAAWEAYVEDVVKEGFSWLLAARTEAKDWPHKVLTLASKELRESANELDVWKLAGDGWRKVLEAHREAVFRVWVDQFSTPSSAKVAELCEKVLGLRALKGHWAWHGMTPAKAATKLDGYVTMRGAIAHRTTAGNPVRKKSVALYLGHIERLVAATDTAVANHLERLAGKRPWR